MILSLENYPSAAAAVVGKVNNTHAVTSSGTDCKQSCLDEYVIYVLYMYSHFWLV